MDQRSTRDKDSVAHGPGDRHRALPVSSTFHSHDSLIAETFFLFLRTCETTMTMHKPSYKAVLSILTL